MGRADMEEDYCWWGSGVLGCGWEKQEEIYKVQRTASQPKLRIRHELPSIFGFAE